MPRYKGFIGPSDRTQSIIADPERTMNWYIEVLPRSALNQAALYPTPGFQSLLTVADIGGRALASMNSNTRAVMGAGVYGINVATATATKYATVAQDNNPATISYNGIAGNQVFYTSGTNGYTENLTTNVVTQVANLNGKATMGGMLDGYFIAFDQSTSTIYISNLNDGLTFDPTQFAQRSAAPDKWLAMTVNAPDIWLIGEQTGDVWYDAGSFPFPFAPRPGANFKYGIAAAFSLKPVGASVMWLSHSIEGAGIVVQAQGYTPQRVSTPAVETAIAGYQLNSSISDAEAFAYQDQGHTFYVLNFPSANATWCYDLSTGLWHERGTWVPANNRYDVWHPRVHCHTTANGYHLTAERSTGTISKMDTTFGSEADSSAIRRLRIAPSLFNEHRQIPPINRLEVFLESGLGLSTGQGSDPTVMWRTSDDGGKTFGRIRTASAGALGNYTHRVLFTGMGTSRNRVNEMTVTDPIPWRIIDAYINNFGEQGGA